MLKKLIFLALVPAFVLAKSNMVSLNLNDTDLEFALERSDSASNSSRMYYGVEFLKAEDEYDKDHNQISGHFSIIGNTPLRGLGVGIGFRAVVTQIKAGGKTYNPLAIPIQLGAIYTLPVVLKSHVSAFVSYAPESLCVNDCESFTEYRFEGAIEPIDGGMIVLGHRNIEYDIKSSKDDYGFNKALYLGFRLYF